MIEASLGALIGLLTLVVLVALLLGAVVLRIVRKKDAEDELFGVRGLDNSKRLNLPPLLSTETNPVLKTAIQPSSLRRSFRSGVFGGLFRRGDNPDIVIDSPPHDVNGDYVGKINFGLSFDKQAQTLAVHVIQAADLPVKDITGSSDPYVRICLLPDLNVVKVTRVHRRNLAPAFNQTVVFTGPGTFFRAALSLSSMPLNFVYIAKTLQWNHEFSTIGPWNHFITPLGVLLRAYKDHVFSIALASTVLDNGNFLTLINIDRLL